MTTLTELIATFPVGGAAALPQARSTPGLLTPAPMEHYIRPSVKHLEASDMARMLLIEAAGAVGKSTAAEFIAHNRNWILIDASSLQVGHYGLSGLLTRAWPGGEFLEQLRLGKTGIVIDALDEAHLKAGTNGFFAFLEDVATLSQTPTMNGIRVVLLGRPDTAEYVRLKLADLELPLHSTRLDFFTPDAARAFISSHLQTQASEDARDFYDAEKRNPAGFATLREARLMSVAQTLLGRNDVDLDRDWPHLSSFLGYAPVLSVLAESLAVANPFKDAQDASLVLENANNVLTTLTRALLAREQAKFVGRVGPRLQAKAPADLTFDNETLYTPHEQVRRLACELLSIECPSLNVVPAAIQADYEEAAQQWVKDHPFLGASGAVNKVFHDYIWAGATADPLSRLSAIDPSAAGVGPFFYRFLSELAPRENDLPTLPERFVQHAVKSALQASASQHMAWIYVQSGEHADLQIFDPLSGEVVFFSVNDVTGLLEMDAVAQKGFISSSAGVRLVGANDRFELGSNGFISAHDLIIDAPELVVGPGAALLHVVGTADCSRVTRVTPIGGVVFSTRGMSEWPLLRSFQSDDVESKFVSFTEYVNLRSILRGFKRQAAGVLSMYAERMDQGIVKDNEARLQILSGLLNLGILSMSEKHYVLSSTKLAEHGVSLAALNRGEPDDATHRFIRQVLAAGG